MQNTFNLSHDKVFPGLSSQPVEVTSVPVLISFFKLNKPGHDASNHCLRFTKIWILCLGNLPLPHLGVTLCWHHLCTRTKIKSSLKYYRLTPPVPNYFNLVHHYTPHFCPDSISHISHKRLCILSLTKQMESLPFIILKHDLFTFPLQFTFTTKKRTREMAS